MLECLPIKTENGPRFRALDGGSTRGSIHQSKLSKIFATFVGLEVGLFAIENLTASILAGIDNIENISLLAFLDNGLVFFDLLNGHGIDDNIEFVLG